MHFLQTIIIALMATSATAFTLPGGLEDGLYRAYYDKEGREVHEPVGNVTTTAPTRRHKARRSEASALDSLEKRQLGATYDVYCGCGYGLDHGDCDAAVSDLSNQFGGYDGYPCATILEGMSYYSIRGSVVAFGCNTGTAGDIGICGNEYGEVLQVVTVQCGAYTAGTFAYLTSYNVPLPEPYINLGYMQYYAGLDFCGNADLSPVSYC